MPMPSSAGKVSSRCCASSPWVGRVAAEPAVVDAVAEAVDGLVAAEQDPAVGREPVVVEAVAAVGDPLPALPADRAALLGAQRLGDDHVVVDRRHEPADRARERGIGAGGEQDAVGPHPAAGRAQLRVQDRRPLEEPHAEAQRRAPQARARARPGRPGPRRCAGGRRRGTWGRRPRPARPRGRAPPRPSRSAAAAPPPRRARRARAARVATESMPVSCHAASIRWRSRSAFSPARFSRPSASSASSSCANRAAPLSSPWVKEASTKPPLRPLAPQPAVSASSSTTSRSGRSRLACTAAHRPVKPPPTIARSASTVPSSGGASAGRGRSSQ